MDQGKRRKYDAEFKLKIVMMVLKNESTQAEICRRYQLASSLLNKWRNQFIEAGLQGLKKPLLSPTDKAVMGDLRREVEKRDQIIGELTVANQLLKKSAYSL